MDPTLDLQNANGTVIDLDDNWTDDPVAAAQLTAIVAGKNGDIGMALIEIYNLR